MARRMSWRARIVALVLAAVVGLATWQAAPYAGVGLFIGLALAIGLLALALWP